jgi:spectinomycin phosphotransferase
VLSPPDGLAPDALVEALAREWGVTATLTYRPVGFGSHHWLAEAGDGGRWFVTVDELETKRHTVLEPFDAAFDRLRAGLAAATDLRAHGHGYVVAPVPTRGGEPVVRLDERHGMALFPYVAGESFAWGAFAPGQRQALLDLVVAVHTAPRAARRRALADDFTIPHRDELAAALDNDDPGNPGPYAGRTRALLAARATAVRRLLARYDELVAASPPDRAVLTHGEPHPGNTMRTAEGWRLIDWDTALVAPPERDLWNLADGSMLDRYAAATGVRPLPEMLELYRIRWDLADVAVCVSRFRAPHTGNADDEKSWQILRDYLNNS